MLLAALVHFCELNGPSVVFVTQEAPRKAHVGDGGSDSGDDTTTIAAAAGSGIGGCKGCNPYFPPRSTLADCLHDALDSFPDLAPDIGTSPTPPAQVVPSVITPPGTPTSAPSPIVVLESIDVWPAAADTAGASDVHTISATIHSQQRTTFLGAKNPIDNDMYPVLRTACVRSLSCELTQTRSGGAVFFSFNPATTADNMPTVYCLSYMFQLLDSTSRGNVRAYAFIVVSQDRSSILLNWDLLVGRLATLSARLQTLAEQVTSSSVAKVEQSQQSSRVPGKDSMRAKGHPLIGTLSPEQFLRRRGNPVPSVRSLVDIVGVKSLFVSIHMHFSWILFALMSSGIAAPPPTKILPPVVECPVANNNAERISIAALYRSLSPRDMVHFFSHLFMGDQIILRGASGPTLALLGFIRTVLPDVCLSTLTPVISDAYHESWECNVLLLPPETTIPVDHLCASNAGFCVLDATVHSIVLSCHSYTSISPLPPDQSLALFGDDEEWHAARISTDITRALACCFRAGVDDTQLDDIAGVILARVVAKWIGLGHQFVTLTKSPSFNADQTPVPLILQALLCGDYSSISNVGGTASSATSGSISSLSSIYTMPSASTASLMLTSPLLSSSVGTPSNSFTGDTSVGGLMSMANGSHRRRNARNTWSPSSPSAMAAASLVSSVAPRHPRRQTSRLSLTAFSQGVGSSLRRLSSALSSSVRSVSSPNMTFDTDADYAHRSSLGDLDVAHEEIEEEDDDFEQQQQGPTRHVATSSPVDVDHSNHRRLRPVDHRSAATIITSSTSTTGTVILTQNPPQQPQDLPDSPPATTDELSLFRYQIEWDVLVLKFLSKVARQRR
ncbi:hypothetical protein RI367_004772 [Sorochytrium milnesiophthora]